MSAPPPVLRPFGPYLLFRQTSADPLGSTFRAGTLDRPKLRPFVTVRLFDGASIDRAALLSAMEAAVEVIDDVRAPSVARGSVFGAVDDLPFAAVEDVPGQPLEALFQPRASGAGLPLEQSLFLVERLLAALEAARAVELVSGAAHGFLVPAFVHVSYDGEPLVWGFGLGKGLLPALSDARERPPFAPYLAPDVLDSGRPTTSGDLFSAGALLFEALTARPPSVGDALAAVETATVAIDGQPVPEAVKQLLRRMLHHDPARRERDVAVLHREISRLVHGGPYPATTFNFAFFFQQQFERSIRSDQRDRDAEEQVASARPAGPAVLPQRPAGDADDVVPPTARREAAASGVASRPSAEGGDARKAPAPAVRAPARTISETPKRGHLGGVPVWIVGGGLVAALSAGGVWFWRFLSPAAALRPAPEAVPAPAPTAPPATPAPIVVGKDDPLFQQAVQQRLQEELAKRQAQQQRDQQLAERKRQADLDRAAEEGRKAREAEEAAAAARDRSDREEAVRLAREAQEARRRAEAAATAARAAETPAVQEGDLVDISQVDTEPAAVRTVRPEITPLARLRRVSGTVLLRVLVNELGQSEEVRILRDTSPRVGLGETSKAALSRWTWTPATKDGRKVKTWTTVPVPFVLE